MDVSLSIDSFQQVSLVCQFVKKWIECGNVRIFPQAQAHMIRIQFPDKSNRVRVALGIPGKVKAGLHFVPRPSIQQDHIQRDLAGTHLFDHIQQLISGAVICPCHPEPIAPNGKRWGLASQVGEGSDNFCGCVSCKEEEVQIGIFHLGNVTAV